MAVRVLVLVAGLARLRGRAAVRRGCAAARLRGRPVVAWLGMLQVGGGGVRAGAQ